jgi:hypothetical protein
MPAILLVNPEITRVIAALLRLQVALAFLLASSILLRTTSMEMLIKILKIISH